MAPLVPLDAATEGEETAESPLETASRTTMKTSSSIMAEPRCSKRHEQDDEDDIAVRRSLKPPPRP